MAKSFGDLMRDIGRALGFGGGGGGTASGAGGTVSSIGSDLQRALNQQRFGGDKDGPERPVKPETPATPATPATPVIPPVTPAPEVPRPPKPVNPSDMTPTGPVEAAAIESVQGGQASTILTSAMGLKPEDEPFGLLARRKSLLGQGLIE